MSSFIGNSRGSETLRSPAGDNGINPLLLAQAAVDDSATGYHEQQPRTPAKRQGDDGEGTPGSDEKRLKAYPTPPDDKTGIKPEHTPEVWARTRMSLCETLSTWYCAYNSSLYMKDLVARGLYIDSGAHRHDILQAQVIVCNIGGGLTLNDTTKKMERMANMNPKSREVRALSKAQEKQQLILVIVGSGHPFWPVPVQYDFNVLDFFIVTDIWSELEVMPSASPFTDDPDTAVVFRVRLQKADLNKPSWWDPSTSHHINETTSIAPVRTCKVCMKASKQVLTTGWTCLNHECTALFRDCQGRKITSMTYSDALLNERTLFHGPIPAIKPQKTDNEAGQHGTDESSRGGIVCDNCGCCTSRIYWNKWQCEHCSESIEGNISAYPAEQLQKDNATFNLAAAKKQKKVRRDTGNQLATILDAKSIHHRQTTSTSGLYKVTQFLLPGLDKNIIGSVTVLSATDLVRERGCDEMFRKLSMEDIGLRRNTVSGGQGRNRGLSRHFQQNFGAVYKFGVTVQSKGFEEAPDAILQAVQQLKWAGKTAMPLAHGFIRSTEGVITELHTGNVDFNECLALGYMSNDMINYHDDGEKECGPTVATLSLGSPAMMYFRPKEDKKIKDGEDKKRGAKDPLKGAKMRDVVTNAPKTAAGEYPPVLAFPLYHGDILVMNGCLIHRYYEHKVEPHGGRRFALTCRYMDPDRMATEEDKTQAAIKGTLPPHAQKFEYHGDGWLSEYDRTQ
ncbi:hypothetical protein GE09DRAFT_206578 [Coniochaeta sp. 2T2.1]|nr:hypothetical protein GE09DRAFT_206578 [Coniochaeta sp. 2T2.1]